MLCGMTHQNGVPYSDYWESSVKTSLSLHPLGSRYEQEDGFTIVKINTKG